MTINKNGPLVFICSPYAGEVITNTESAKRYCRFAMHSGVVPVAPHLLFPQFLDDTDPYERRLGILCGLALMLKCREVWVFGSRVSPGMTQEIEEAKRLGKPIRCFNTNCEEV